MGLNSNLDKAVYRVLFICFGNLCRSPMAQASMVSRVPKRLKNKVEVLSAGLNAISNLPPTVEAELAARLKGYDLSSHRSTPVSETMLMNVDIILTMEPNQEIALKDMYPRLALKIHNLCDYADGKTDSISDPYGGDVSVYSDILDKIDVRLKKIEKKIWKIARKKLQNHC